MSLKTFQGGVHPPDCKALSQGAAIAEAPVPETLLVPLSQHIGKPAAPVVKVTDTVKRGQVIGEAQGFISAAVHAPVSGTVKRLTTAPQPNGGTCSAVLLENDGEDTWAEGCNVERDPDSLDAEAIRAAAAAAGLVGMGGASFPTHVKLSPPPNKPIDAVLLNGVECEPYLTADYRLMLESPATILAGLRLILRAVGCSRGIVGVEANKEDAFALLEKACAEASGGGLTLSAELLEVKYPQGGEKQLIKALLDREVPSGGLPMDVGVVVQNVGTAHALYEACAANRPLTERIVTVSGDGVARPANWRSRVGTPIRVLLEQSGFDREATRKLVLGGPMMGMAHFDVEVPVSKGMSGILALRDAEVLAWRGCIRCGRCVDGCPAHLMPSELSVLIESGHFSAAAATHVLDCMECGVCTYACPARRPIVQWIKLAKTELHRQRCAEAARQAAAEKNADDAPAEKKE